MVIFQKKGIKKYNIMKSHNRLAADQMDHHDALQFTTGQVNWVKEGNDAASGQ